MASSTGTRYKYLNKFSHARAQLAAWFNHEATCSLRHRHPSINLSSCSLPASLCSSRHGLGAPGWVVPKSGLLTQTQPHRHALTHAPTHTLTHSHTHLLVLQVIPTTAQSLNVTWQSQPKFAILVLCVCVFACVAERVCAVDCVCLCVAS